jgi:hypothetical protein
MQKIEDFIVHQECPSVDGIIFPDETIQLLQVDVDWTQSRPYKVTIDAKTSIGLLEGKGELYWSSCCILIELTDKEHTIKVIAGEATYGGDGFVCVIDSNSKKLSWLAFFRDSNPFNQVEISGKELRATSSLGYVWRFKLNDPVNCFIECTKQTFKG